MCPKEQQTSNNLIVKDNCFILDIFDKCSFSARGGGGGGGGGNLHDDIMI